MNAAASRRAHGGENRAKTRRKYRAKTAPPRSKNTAECLAAALARVVFSAVVKCSLVTWQLRRLHAELDAIDQQDDLEFVHEQRPAVVRRQGGNRDRAIRRILVDRLLRSLPKKLGFRDARLFMRAFARANHLLSGRRYTRRRLTPAQVEELERRVMSRERPSDIARAVHCAEQTVLNRAAQLRKRLADQHERDASGI